MNYCEHHLGDYAKRTGAFTMLEHGAYAKLRDRYFVTEAPIPAADVYRQAGARTKDERVAVDVVLAEFYRLDGPVWRCEQFDSDVSKAQAKIKAAQNNGKLGGRPRRTETEPTENPAGFGSVTQEKALQTPDTRHQPTVSSKPGVGRASRLPADWDPGEPGFAFASSQGLTNGKAQAELAKFRDYWTSKPGKDGTKLDWMGTWRNWVRTAVERGGAAPGPKTDDIFAGAR